MIELTTFLLALAALTRKFCRFFMALFTAFRAVWTLAALALLGKTVALAAAFTALFWLFITFFAALMTLLLAALAAFTLFAETTPDGILLRTLLAAMA